jgi:hypothetical protein
MTSSAGGSRTPYHWQPVDRRLEYWPVIHCELCGAAAIAVLPSTQFCIDCGLYVCAGCWRDTVSRCSTCALLVKRPSRKLHVWTLRRADRRLREVIADLAEPDDDTEHGWDRRAQATIKIDASLRAREAAVAHLPRARKQSRVIALLRRFERNLTAARAAIERPRVSRSRPRFAADIPSRGSVAQLALLLRLPRGRYQWITWIAAGTAAAVVTAFLGLSLIATEIREEGIAEGVLSGGPQEGAASSPSSAPAGAARPGVTASPTRNSDALFDFDGRQMGSGLGPGWREAGGGEVVVAAFPTGVDRSARLVADGTAPARTCRTFDAGARAVAVDVFLDPPAPVAARLELADAADGPVIAMDLSESRSVVSIASDVVEGAGVQLANWIHVEMRSEDGGVAWEVTQENGPGPSLQGRSEGRTTEVLTKICLGVEASAGGAAHYDNLAIIWTIGEGG